MATSSINVLTMVELSIARVIQHGQSHGYPHGHPYGYPHDIRMDIRADIRVNIYDHGQRAWTSKRISSPCDHWDIYTDIRVDIRVELSYEQFDQGPTCFDSVWVVAIRPSAKIHGDLNARNAF